MSASNVTNANIQLALARLGSTGALSSGAGQSLPTGEGVSFADVALQVASLQAQTLGSLMNSGAPSGAGDSSSLNALLASLNASATAAAASSTGRVSSLSDPEAAWQMMSFINRQEVAFKSQFSELGKMQSALAGMQHNAESLGGISTASDNESIRAKLQKFADEYNGWVQSFDADMQDGGTLAGTRAAQVSRYELEQGVTNIFNGARDGLHGLGDIGLSIDPVSKLAVLDGARLDAVLASNKSGAVNAVQEFSVSFAKSAEMLNSDGNFIKNRLDNLSRVISYISDNKPALQAEFGLGDPPPAA
jgi:flagellar capping protein FliD